jgi:hypothetical protein
VTDEQTRSLSTSAACCFGAEHWVEAAVRNECGATAVLRNTERGSGLLARSDDSEPPATSGNRRFCIVHCGNATMTSWVLSVDRGMTTPIESAAQDAFDYEVVGRAGEPDTDADIDFPQWRDVQVGNGEDLLLLVVHR